MTETFWQKRVRKLNKKILRLFQVGGRLCGLEVLPASSVGIDPVRDAAAFAGRPFKHVFDVGANEGQTALQFTRTFPEATVYSFEPFPDGFEKLCATAKLRPKIKPFQLALGDQAGRRKFYLTRSTCTHSLLPTSPQAHTYLGKRMDSAGEIEVTITTLDSFCAEHHIPQIDLLKLDVQGYELNVLAGASGLLNSRKIGLILTEVNFVPLYESQAYFHQVYQFLLDRGFQLVSLYNETRWDGPALNWADALFVNKQGM